MNVQLISMPFAEARAAFNQYRAAVRGDRASETWKKEDAALMRAYKSLAQGTRVIDLLGVMKLGGVRADDGFPKFAIARSDAKIVWCARACNGAVRFNIKSRWDTTKKHGVNFPADTLPRFDWSLNRRTDAETLVPIVPPKLRPRFDLSGYYTFWEVESWTLTPPRDPMLLKHIGGWLYAVLAIWDLTDLERAVIGAPAHR